MQNASSAVRNASARAAPARETRDHSARDLPAPGGPTLAHRHGVPLVPISEVLTAAVGFAGITSALNDRSLSARAVLRWMLSFAAITVVCLLGEAITAHRLIGG
jgi:hypothetical protein